MPIPSPLRYERHTSPSTRVPPARCRQAGRFLVVRPRGRDLRGRTRSRPGRWPPWYLRSAAWSPSMLNFSTRTRPWTEDFAMALRPSGGRCTTGRPTLRDRTLAGIVPSFQTRPLEHEKPTTRIAYPTGERPWCSLVSTPGPGTPALRGDPATLSRAVPRSGWLSHSRKGLCAPRGSHQLPGAASHSGFATPVPRMQTLALRRDRIAAW